MGVTGLLKTIRSSMQHVSPIDMRNRRVGIDASSWLFGALYSKAHELLKSDSISSNSIASGVVGRAFQLQKMGANPILVFDGRSIKNKQITLEKRETKRTNNRELAKEMKEKGDRASAVVHLKRSVGFSKDTVRADLHKVLVQALMDHDIEFCFAPFEADAQLVHLQRTGCVDMVVSGDSDMLVFGSPKTIFSKGRDYKLCNLEDALQVLESRESLNTLQRLPKKWDSARNLIEEASLNWSSMLPFANLVGDEVTRHTILRDSAILSGCDYTVGLPGLGFTRAHCLFSSLGTVEKVVETLEDRGYSIPHKEKYLYYFRRAQACFSQHIVFDPSTKNHRFLNEPLLNHPSASFVGDEQVADQESLPAKEGMIQNLHSLLGQFDSSEKATSRFYGLVSRANKLVKEFNIQSNAFYRYHHNVTRPPSEGNRRARGRRSLTGIRGRNRYRDI